MSKLTFSPRLSPRTAVHAIRGLALGTSCSLILISEERLKRLELAQAVADNGKLLKSQRCYNPGGTVAAMAQLEYATASMSVTPATDDAVEYTRETPREERGKREEAEEQARWTARPPATFQKDGIFHKAKFPSLKANLSTISTQGVPMPRHRWARNCRQHVAVMQDISRLQERISRTPSNTKVPEAILKEAQALLVTLYRRRDIIATHTVVDALCSYPGFDHEDLSIPDVDPKFILRSLVYATRASKRRPPRRFKLAVYKFWTELKKAAPAERAALFQALAEEFERDSSGRTMHSFLATSHVRFGRYRTCKLLVLPVAEVYRAQDKADALALWLSRAEEAGVPICASSPGRKFLKEVDTEPNALDTAQETYTPEDACVMRFRDDIRRPLKKLKKYLDAAQLQTFSGMSEAARARDWQRVLYCYSDSLKSNVTISDACLRLAVEAAVELEGIHSATALRLVKQARKESLDVETIMQTLLLARIDGIGDQQAATRSSASVGDAYRLIESLLSAVQPVYPRPSELVYNRAIRVCLQNSEFEQTVKLCMQLGEEHWNGDALFQVHNFASLLTVAVRSKDHALLQKLLEALPGRPYRGHPICKWSLRRARFWLEQMIAKTTSVEEKQKHLDALESLEAAYQNVMQARAQAHWHFKAKLRSIARETLAPKRNYESVETVYKASGSGHAAAIYERSLGEDTNLSLL